MLSARTVASSRPRGIRPALALLAGVIAAAAMPSVAAAKLPPGPAPQFADCLGWRGPGMCVWKAGYVGFELSKRVLHVGDTVTGSYRWGPLGYDSYSVTFSRGGAGLRTIKCTSLKGMAIGGKGATGSQTCTWKATRATGSWQIGPQITLHGNAGAGAWPYQDFYVVLGKEKVISGRVVRENIDKTTKAQRQGIRNVVVKIHGPESKSVRTDGDGFYIAEVKRSGRYRVTPAMTKKIGNSNAVKPKSKVVSVSSSKAATADFEVADNLEVTGKVDKAAVSADGRGAVELTLTATQYGEPEPNLVVAVMPNGESAGSDPDLLPVPARYCTDNRVSQDHWPSIARGGPSFEAPLDVQTDASGTAKVRIQLGTVPGKLRVKWWARKADGKLNYNHIALVSGEVAIDNTSTQSYGGYFAGLQQVLQSGGPTLPGETSGLLRTLRSDPRYALGVSYTFVNAYPGNVSGVLVAPQTARHTIATDKTITPAPGSFIIPPYLLPNSVLIVAGSFSGAVASGAINTGITPEDFLAGKNTIQWSGWSPSAATKLYDEDGTWVGAGYPYDAVSGGC